MPIGQTQYHFECNLSKCLCKTSSFNGNVPKLVVPNSMAKASMNPLPNPCTDFIAICKHTQGSVTRKCYLIYNTNRSADSSSSMQHQRIYSRTEIALWSSNNMQCTKHDLWKQSTEIPIFASQIKDGNLDTFWLSLCPIQETIWYQNIIHTYVIYICWVSIVPV